MLRCRRKLERIPVTAFQQWVAYAETATVSVTKRLQAYPRPGAVRDVR